MATINFKTSTNSKLLLDEDPMMVIPGLAVKLGLNEAIVLQQIHYWIRINLKAEKNIINGRVWTYNTYEKWQSQNFRWWSVRTLKRIFSNLHNQGILIKANLNQDKSDQTLWYSIDYEKLEEILNEDNQSNSNIDTVDNVNNVDNQLENNECQVDTMSKIANSEKIHSDKMSLSTECQVGTLHNDTMSLSTIITETTFTKTKEKENIILSYESSVDKAMTWEIIKKILKNELTETSYKTWIESSIEKVDITNNCFSIITINDFTKNILKERYETIIKNAYKSITGKDMNIEIRS